MNKDSTFSTTTLSVNDDPVFYKTVWGHWGVRTKRADTLGGRVCEIRNISRVFHISSSTTQDQIDEQLKIFRQDTNFNILLETPTLKCSGCTTPCWYFIEDQQQSTRICLGPHRHGCGRSYKMAYQQQGQLYLNDDGKSNKGMWECTPGMTSDDSHIVIKGKLAFPSHEKFHHANMRKIQRLIDDIMDDLPSVMGSESICRTSKNILRRLYSSIHNEDSLNSDNNDRMWHSPPNIAATCILCAVLAFETRIGSSTVFTVPLIVEVAQGYVPRKRKRRRYDRRPRDVSVRTILKYAKRLRKYKIVSVELPKEIPIEWTMHASSNVRKEHARLAEFKKCSPVRVHMPHNKPWGMTFEEIPNFIQVDSVEPGQPAFNGGIIAGDYIIQVNDTNISINTKVDNVMEMIIASKNLNKNVSLTLMRKK